MEEIFERIEIPLFAMKDNLVVIQEFENYDQVVLYQIYGGKIVARDC